MLHNQKLDPELCRDTFNNHLVVITGSTSGIGYDAAKKYASLGADILSINRNEEKTKKLCEELKQKYGTECTYMIADFSKIDQVHNVAKKLASLERNIDVLIHNAGVYVTQRTITEDDLEQVFQTNYLSTFIINYYIKDKFIKQNRRIG